MTLGSHHYATQPKNNSKLRLLQTENPKEYWKIIVKGEKTSEILSNISLHFFKEHFDKLAIGYKSVDVSDTNDELNNIPPNNILNTPITPQGIMEAKLKKTINRGGGLDQIINEFLKHSRHEFAPYYTEYLT